MPSAGPAGLVVAMIVAALLFDPLKNWIQERLDRVFYRKRYDYRRTLIEFGRDLSSETDLDKMLGSVTDRLSRTLLVDRIAIFLADSEQPEHFRLAKSFGISDTGALDLGFLERRAVRGRPPVLREHAPGAARIADRAAGHRPPGPELLHPLHGAAPHHRRARPGQDRSRATSSPAKTWSCWRRWPATSASPSRTPASTLRWSRRWCEYERLKDFNENIVESISVGVLAVDLEDRIESWNSQMEVMYAKPRAEVLGRALSEVFPASFVENFYRVRQTAGIHNLYKFRLETPHGRCAASPTSPSPRW